MKRDRGDVVEAVHGFAIQGLDIAKRVGELHSRHANLIGRHAVKHESVVGVWTMGDGDVARASSGGAGHKTYRSGNGGQNVTGAFGPALTVLYQRLQPLDMCSKRCKSVWR